MFYYIFYSLDCAVLDIQTLEYKQYLLVPAFMYIVLGMKYQQFSLEQIVEEFPTSSMYLLNEEEYAFNNLFGYFMYYYFGIELVDLLPTIQYASTYFYFSIELRLPSIIDYKRDEISDVSIFLWIITLRDTMNSLSVIKSGIKNRLLMSQNCGFLSTNNILINNFKGV